MLAQTGATPELGDGDSCSETLDVDSRNWESEAEIP